LRFTFVVDEQSLSVYVNDEKKFVTTCKTKPSSKETKTFPLGTEGKNIGVWVKHCKTSDLDEEISITRIALIDESKAIPIQAWTGL